MKLAIFDLDGVIVSTDRFHYRAWKSLADKNNLMFNEQMNHLLRGVSRTESLKIILEVNGREVACEEFNQMLTEKNNTYKALLNELTSKDILPGVIPFLEDLKANHILMAVGSSSKNAPFILKRICLEDFFHTVVDGNCIVNSKPDPEVFLKCAERMGVEPNDCVVFEDAVSGVEAAVRGGMLAIGVGKEMIKGASLMMENLMGLSTKNLLDQISENFK